jgi:alpha-L-fucosidase
MNALLLQEPIALGQRIKKFHVDITNASGETERIDAQTIGHKRIIPFKQRKVISLKITFDESRGQVLMSNLEVLNLISTRNEPLYQ